MQRTRCQILEILKKRGGTTLDELSNGVGLSPVTIRAHLAVLERDALVKSEEVRGKVGRPHYVYSLTPKADEWFPRTNHIVANRILDALIDLDGQQVLDKVAARMAERWAEQWANRVQGVDLETRVAELAAVRSEEGAIAEWKATEDGYLLRQHHCACWQIARYHPMVCEAEIGYMRRLLRASVQRGEFRVNGGNACSYIIRAENA